LDTKEELVVVGHLIHHGDIIHISSNNNKATIAMRYHILVGLVMVAMVVSTTTAAATEEEEEESPNKKKKPAESQNNTSSNTPAPFYTCYDDASWAIVSPHVSSKLHRDKQQMYEDFMAGCVLTSDILKRGNSCEADEANRLEMNAHQPAAMRNFTRHGFIKLRAPTEVMTLLQDYFARHQHAAKIEWNTPTPYHNNWISPPTIVGLDNTSLHGGGPQLSARIGRAVQDVMQNWTGGQRLSVTSVYGIRIYHRNSILTPHVDRLPLVSSAIINVAQDVDDDEDWPLEVYDHDGVAHNVTMQPGDMVLYESHSVIHGRPFPLKGNYFANVFVHFEPLGLLHGNQQQQQQHEENDGAVSQQQEYEALAFSSGLPHYIIPGTAWAQKWWEKNPRGWSLFTDIEALIKRGDLDTLRYIHQHRPLLLKEAPLAAHTGWQPIHEAIRDAHYDIVQFLVETVGANVNADCHIPHHMTPLALSRFYHGTQHEMSLFLERHGAVEPEIGAQVRAIHEARKLKKLHEQQEREQLNHDKQNSQQQQQQQPIYNSNHNQEITELRRQQQHQDRTDERSVHVDEALHRRLKADVVAATRATTTSLGPPGEL
jgi:prolyl 4-hydroxylase